VAVGFVVLASCLALAACPRPAVLAPEPIEVVGMFVHAPSRFEFPPRYGEFERIEINQFDAEGNTVGVDYHLDADLTITLTLYVKAPLRAATGEPLSLPNQLDVEEAAIGYAHHDATRRAAWTPRRTRNGETEPGHARAFRYHEHFGGSLRLVTSVLYLFAFDGWVVKIRATFPAFQEQPAHAVVQTFVSTFPWRGDHPPAAP
jgi:hypothetical protein